MNFINYNNYELVYSIVNKKNKQLEMWRTFQNCIKNDAKYLYETAYNLGYNPIATDIRHRIDLETLQKKLHSFSEAVATFHNELKSVTDDSAILFEKEKARLETELQILQRDFGFVDKQLYLEKKQEIHLSDGKKDYFIGNFSIKIDRSLKIFMQNTDRIKDHYYDGPHINNAIPCLGELKNQYDYLRSDVDLIGIAEVIDLFSTSYNPESVYKRIKWWSDDNTDFCDGCERIHEECNCDEEDYEEDELDLEEDEDEDEEEDEDYFD